MMQRCHPKCPKFMYILVTFLIATAIVVHSMTVDPVVDNGSTAATCLHNERRLLLAQVALTGSLLPLPARAAAPPISELETQGVRARALRALRAKPPKLLRTRVAQDFAVLLMRTSYQVTDALDIVAMDQFQRDFFLIRAAEYSTYINDLGPGMVHQGDLTDPYYFDFISFAQYATIDRIIAGNPPLVFTEQQAIDKGPNEPNEFVETVVRRDPSLSNDRLVNEFRIRVGTKILDKLIEQYGSTPAALPAPPKQGRVTADELVLALDQLVKLFLLNGFAFGGSAKISKSSANEVAGAQFSLELQSPATLWGGSSLQLQRSKVSNDFLAMTAVQYLQLFGYKAFSRVEYKGTQEIALLQIIG